MKQIIIAVLLLASALSLKAQSINSAASMAEFEIGNMGFKTVQGTIKGMKGEVKFNSSNLEESLFNVTINPGSIDTENEKRDEHLKKEDFFNITEFVTIHFQSSQIIKNGDRYIARGKLTMLGETNSVEIPFSVEIKKNAKIFKGELTISREDYNLGTESFGNFMMGKTVDVKITCVYE